MLKVYIWGIGEVAKNYIKTGEILENHKLLGFIQSQKSAERFENKKIYEPQEIINTIYDYILVCVDYAAKEIFDLAKKVGVPESKIIFVNNYEWIDGTPINKLLPAYKKINPQQNCSDLQIYFPEFCKMEEEKAQFAERYIIIRRTGFDMIEKNNWLQKTEFLERVYQEDYCRYRSFELYANEIIKNNIDGDVAEVGVFKGTFSRLINAHFPQKTLYLFDTFTSFDENEFLYEVKMGRAPKDFIDVFKDTSVEEVLKRMIYPERCVVKKGLFPETAIGLEKLKFAFVSIDVDLEKSILESLRYFYPRLNRGGAIFIHDYNNLSLEGVKKAVDIYEEEQGHKMSKVPLADEGGTLVVVK